MIPNQSLALVPVPALFSDRHEDLQGAEKAKKFPRGCLSLSINHALFTPPAIDFHRQILIGMYLCSTYGEDFGK